VILQQGFVRPGEKADNGYVKTNEKPVKVIYFTDPFALLAGELNLN
jgi:hypothetical protein